MLYNFLESSLLLWGYSPHLSRLSQYGKILRQLQWIWLHWIRPKSQPNKPNRLSLRLLWQSGKAFSLTRRIWTAGLRTTWVSIELELVFTSLLSLYVSVVVFVWHNPLARCLDEGIYAEVCTLFCLRKSVPCEFWISSDWLYFSQGLFVGDCTVVCWWQYGCLLVTVRLTGCKIHRLTDYRVTMWQTHPQHAQKDQRSTCVFAKRLIEDQGALTRAHTHSKHRFLAPSSKGRMS